MFSKKSILMFISIFLCAHCLEFVPKQFQKRQLQVETSSGRVQGTRMKSGNLKNGYYFAYLGIPYAEPPVGDLRFRPPKSFGRWSGVLDGRQQGSACIETLLQLPPRPSEVTGNEDCLFLNVFTLTNPTTTKKLKAVMVFIHGGGFILGNSDVKFYGPDLLLAKDVIVVTFNYRLGLFGFLSTEDLASPGNFGLKDQNLALRWVQKNIKNFGGDPDNVTIFGHSAGAVSAHLHMLSPKSRRLFHKVLLESGSALCLWGSQQKPRNLAYLTGLANGITNPKDSRELVEKLRALDVEQLKQSLLGVVFTGLLQSFYYGIPFAPTLEEDHAEAFLTRKNWYETLRDGNFHKVPIVMGMNSNEALFFLLEASTLQPLLAVFDTDNSFTTPTSLNISTERESAKVGRMIMDHYFGKNSRVSAVNSLELIHFESEDKFLRPIWKTAELMSQHTPLYFYYFRYESDLGRRALPEERAYKGIGGVSHEEELHFIFHKHQHSSKRKNDYVVRERLITMWTNFAKFSNPTPLESISTNASENSIWPLFSTTNSPKTAFLEIDQEMSVKNMLENHENIIWWEKIFQKYGNPPFHLY